MLKEHEFLSAARTLHMESPPDCYCVVSLNEARIAHTRVTPQSNNPQWGERFVLLVAHDTEEVPHFSPSLLIPDE